eukprot:3440436-Rhodomonas_salina.2
MQAEQNDTYAEQRIDKSSSITASTYQLAKKKNRKKQGKKCPKNQTKGSTDRGRSPTPSSKPTALSSRSTTSCPSCPDTTRRRADAQSKTHTQPSLGCIDATQAAREPAGEVKDKTPAVWYKQYGVGVFFRFDSGYLSVSSLRVPPPAPFENLAPSARSVPGIA